MSWFVSETKTEEPVAEPIPIIILSENDQPEYTRLIHPSQGKTDSLEDGNYDIVFTTGGWFVGSIKNGVYYEGKYTYPNGEISTGIFNNRKLTLTNGIYEDKKYIIEGTFLLGNKPHGKNMKRTYKQSKIVFEGEINNGKNNLEKGKYVIPERFPMNVSNISYSLDTRYESNNRGLLTEISDYVWNISFFSGLMKSMSVKDGDIDLNTLSIKPESLVTESRTAIFKFRDDCIFDNYKQTITYPSGFKGFKRWCSSQLRQWIDIKFKNIRGLSAWVTKKKLNGVLFSLMTDEHFKEIGVQGIDLLRIRTEMNKIC